MLNLALAWRNVRRNKRRSTITLMTIAVGAAALLLVGALMNYIVLEFQTSTVRRTGHLAVFKSGYFEYGAGNPAAYGIPDYEAVLESIRRAPSIAPHLLVATPMQVVTGVAGNYRQSTSKTFFGQGVVPEDRIRMAEWNEHHIGGIEISADPLQRPRGVAVGAGLKRILQVCEGEACKAEEEAAPPVEGQGAELLQLIELALEDVPAVDSGGLPSIDLLAATANGAPNVVSVEIERTDELGSKQYDDNFIVMQLPVAQQLVYGRDPARATAINLQLRSTADAPTVRAALNEWIREQGLDLEVRDFVELNSMYAQTQAFFSFLFGFIALVIIVIVLFTIMNTMGMSVMERVGEIGTARALGVQRGGIRSLFVSEGALQGVIGATLGVLLAALLVTLVNQSDMRWSPPTSAGTVPFKLYLFGSLGMIAGVWALLSTVAAIASLVPAHRASRMMIVDALRHV